MLLTGEAGTGKTTVINRLLDWLHERRTPTAYIFNSNLEPKHLFDFMLADFGVPPDPRSNGNALMCLNQWLSERSRQGEVPVLIVDEGQGLPLHVLDEIRMLLNLETPHEKLLQIVLSASRNRRKAEATRAAPPSSELRSDVEPAPFHLRSLTKTFRHA